jgi:uncharacterized beta-barrel protein YwiB (DUF1934 family)
MEKEVRVYIKGNQYIENGEASEESTVEETAVGKLYERNGKIYVTFEEMTDEDPVPNKVMLKISESSFEMTRKGLIDSNFIFEKENAHKSDYVTPFGIFKMSVFTKDLSVYVDKEKINLHAVYDMEINDEFAGENETTIEITVI